MVSDEDFKKQISLKPERLINPESALKAQRAFLNNKKLNSVLITDRMFKSHTGFKPAHTIVIKNSQLFGNVEPVWDNLKKQLPKNADLFLLNLGTEKFLIGPRLKLIFNKSVFDIAGEPLVMESKTNKFKKIIKRLIKK